MAQENRTRPLAFDGTFVKAHMVCDARDYKTTGVVTNLSDKPLYIAGEPYRCHPALAIDHPQGGRHHQCSCASVVHVPDDINLGGIALDGWKWLGEPCRSSRGTLRSISRRRTLLPTSNSTLGNSRTTPSPRTRLQQFDIQLNLWWAPAGPMRGSTTRTRSSSCTRRFSGTAASSCSRIRRAPRCTARSASPGRHP